MLLYQAGRGESQCSTVLSVLSDKTWPVMRYPMEYPTGYPVGYPMGYLVFSTYPCIFIDPDACGSILPKFRLAIFYGDPNRGLMGPIGPMGPMGPIEAHGAHGSHGPHGAHGAHIRETYTIFSKSGTRCPSRRRKSNQHVCLLWFGAQNIRFSLSLGLGVPSREEKVTNMLFFCDFGFKIYDFP